MPFFPLSTAYLMWHAGFVWWTTWPTLCAEFAEMAWRDGARHAQLAAARPHGVLH